jgi:PKD repeat protein
MRFDSVKVILFMLVILFVLSGAAGASEQSADGAAAVRAELSKLPLSFIPNQGQADPAVLFQVKAEGHTIFLTQEDVVLVADKDGAQAVFSTTVAGANPAAAVVGVDPLPGTASFFIGNDPANWQSGLTTYGGVEYQNVLQGVDLTYRGTNGVLKREFVVAPGADASGIVIVYDNIDGLAYGPDGTLEVTTPTGVMTETAPVCYQVINGNTINVPAQYNILGDGKVGFNFGSYDKTYPLVIDPALLYSSYLGGSVNDAANGIAVHNATGQAVVTGYTDSINFPIDGYPFNQTFHGCSDVFITKVSADGESLVYSTYLGGNATDVGNGVAVNESGWAFITGYTTSEGFPHPNGTAKNLNASLLSPCPFPGCLGNADVFVAAIPPEGTYLPFSTCIGGNNTDVGTSIAINQNQPGFVYVTGFTNSNTSDGFPIIGSASILNLGLSSTACDAFVLNIGIGTPTPVYSSYLGGSDNDQGLGIASSGSTYYLTGWTQSTDFPTPPPGVYTVARGAKDAFVSAFTYPGTAIYSRYLGGFGNDEGRGIAVKNIGGADYAHVTGVTYSTNFQVYPTTGRLGGAAYANSNAGTTSYGDAFITKLQPNGALNWSTYLGGINNDGGNSIALDVNNNVYITGYSSSVDYPSINAIPTFGTKHAFQDAIITMVNANLTSLNFSTYLGGNLDETGTGIAVSDPQNIYISGYTTSFDFPTSLNYPPAKSYITSDGVYGNHFGGWVDGFVAHINNVPTPASPVANFTYDKNGGSFPLTVNFTDTSTGTPTAWQWYFGDGTSIVTGLQNPTHVYNAPGSYYVTLTVSNALGSNATIKGPITVSTPPAPKITNCNSTVAIDYILLATNSTRSLSLLLEYTDHGLSTYNVTMGFNDTQNVTFTGVSHPNWMPAPQFLFDPMSFGLPVYNITFAGVDFNQTKSNYNVSLGCFQIKGNQSGESLLILKNYTLQDYGYNNITLDPRYRNVTIVVKDLKPIPANNTNLPKDPDGDNLYEDVNGDGLRNYGDVIDFFQNFFYIQSVEYWEFFDFNHNGYIDLGDTIGLYKIIYPMP